MSNSNVGVISLANPFFLQNAERQIRRVVKTYEDYISIQRDFDTLIAHMKDFTESSVILATLEEVDSYNDLLEQKMSYIVARNKILDNFFKRINPIYRKELREIDGKLDEISLKIYSLETENTIKESELQETILAAQAALEKYSQYIQSYPSKK